MVLLSQVHLLNLMVMLFRSSKKNILGDIIMKNNNSNGSAYDFSFESLADLKFCISCGAEITFDYNGHLYGIGKITETEYYIGS